MDNITLATGWDRKICLEGESVHFALREYLCFSSASEVLLQELYPSVLTHERGDKGEN